MTPDPRSDVPPHRLFDSTIGDMIITAVERHAARTCFVNPDGSEVRFGALAQEIDHAIRRFDAMGLPRSAAIAQLSANRASTFSVVAACYIGNFRSVALSPMAGIDDLAYILDHSDAALLVTDARNLARCREALAKVPRPIRLACHDPDAGAEHLWEGLDRVNLPQLANRAGAEDIVRMIYTGGTTGKPKGVMGSNASLAMNAMLRMTGHSWPGIRLLCSTPLSHAAGAMVVPVIWHGSSIILEAGFDPDRTIDQVASGAANALYLVPTMLYRLLDHPRCDELAGKLKMIMYGAAPASPARLREARERLGPILHQHYGLTEAPSTILNLSDTDHLDDSLLSSAGKPYPGIAVSLQDESGAEVPRGTVGEICVRGPLLMSGYWKAPELTAAAFRNGWLRSGDLAYQDARGYYFIVDRAKDMIISGGFNVYPKEVEDVIAMHPAVASVGVIGVPDAQWGEAVKAFVVCREGQSVAAEELIELVKARKGPVLAPKTVEFVGQLPLTPLGKVDKKALREAYWPAGGRAVS